MQATPPLPTNFFTLQSMLTLAGATGTVFIVTNGLQVAFNFNPRWLGLFLAQVIALVGVYYSGGKGIDYFVGVVNGFLIYSSAVGVTAMGGGSAGRARGEATVSAEDVRRGTVARKATDRRSFLSPWF